MPTRIFSKGECIILKNKMKILKKSHFTEQWPYAILLLPFVLLFFLFTLLPILSSVALSFFNFDMVSLPKFTGFSNYVRMFLDDTIFITTLKEYLVACTSYRSGRFSSFLCVGVVYK